MFNFCTMIGGEVVITTDQELGVKLEWRVILLTADRLGSCLCAPVTDYPRGQRRVDGVGLRRLHFLCDHARCSTVVKSLCPMNLKSIAHVIAKNKTISKALQNTSDLEISAASTSTPPSAVPPAMCAEPRPPLRTSCCVAAAAALACADAHENKTMHVTCYSVSGAAVQRR